MKLYDSTQCAPRYEPWLPMAPNCEAHGNKLPIKNPRKSEKNMENPMKSHEI